MLTDGPLGDITGRRPARWRWRSASTRKAAGSRAGRARQPAVAPGCRADQDARRGVPDRPAAGTGHARDGITVDFAPVVDDDRIRRRVIGRPPFGPDPRVVTQYAGRLYARGLLGWRGAARPLITPWATATRRAIRNTGGVTTPDPSVTGQMTCPVLHADGTAGRGDGRPHEVRADWRRPTSLSPAAYNLPRGGGYGGLPFGGVVFTDDLVLDGRHQPALRVGRKWCCAAGRRGRRHRGHHRREVPAVLDRLESAVHAGELSEQRVGNPRGKVTRSRAPRERIRIAERRVCS